MYTKSTLSDCIFMICLYHGRQGGEDKTFWSK
nr:MAG TPA: hypothetical protein [Caudoviricetes sp.]